MENYNGLKGRGQVIYVNPKWVTGETCIFNIHNPIERGVARTKISTFRKEFLKRLEKEGFVITYDKNDIKEDVICLVMDELAICEELVELATYKKEFDQRIFQAGGEKLNYPFTLKVEEFFQKPFFPAVFKNENANGGIDKFLIETPEQLEKIKKLYNNTKKNSKYKEAFSCCIFQQLIETPTKHKTYLRVLMSASGDVMGASLKYSRTNECKRKPQGIFEQHFWDEQSEYFLGCNGMFNYYSEGGNIPFSQSRYNSESQTILKEHGIDPNNITIPSDVLEVASSIAKNCNQELGIMCGIDFILNERDNKWYYLEIQAFPAIEEWADTKGIKVIKIKNVKDYIKYLETELQARYDALMMYMDRKKSYDSKKELNKKVISFKS